MSKRYKYLLKDIVSQKNVMFLLFTSFKNKAIASGIFETLQKLVKLRPFKWTIAIIIQTYDRIERYLFSFFL
jgi:hypothetical protein